MAKAIKLAAIVAFAAFLIWAEFFHEVTPVPMFTNIGNNRGYYDEPHRRFLLEVGEYGYFYCNVPRETVIELNAASSRQQFFVSRISGLRCTDEDFSRVTHVDPWATPEPDNDPRDRY